MEKWEGAEKRKRFRKKGLNKRNLEIRGVKVVSLVPEHHFHGYGKDRGSALA